MLTIASARGKADQLTLVCRVGMKLCPCVTSLYQKLNKLEIRSMAHAKLKESQSYKEGNPSILIL